MRQHTCVICLLSWFPRMMVTRSGNRTFIATTMVTCVGVNINGSLSGAASTSNTVCRKLPSKGLLTLPHRLNREVTSINVVPEEEIVGVGCTTSHSEQL